MGTGQGNVEEVKGVPLRFEEFEEALLWAGGVTKEFMECCFQDKLQDCAGSFVYSSVRGSCVESSSCTRTTASLFTFSKPPKSSRSLPSKFTCPTVHCRLLRMSSASCALALVLDRRHVDLERAVSSISPRP